MESNIEVIDQEVEKARAKYGDKDIPQDEIQNFKVSTLVDLYLYWCFLHNAFSHFLKKNVTFRIIKELISYLKL